MTNKHTIIDKLKNDISYKENIINHLAEHNIKLQHQLERKEQECERLKQTFTEIKELAKKAKKDICNNCGWINTDSCDPEDYTCGEFIKILQKISECEELKIYIESNEQQVKEVETLVMDNDRLINELDQLKRDYNKAIKTFMEIEKYCKDCNLKADYTACAVLHIIDRSRVL